MRPLNPEGFHVNVSEEETPETVENSNTDLREYIWIILSILSLIIILIFVYGFIP